MLPCIRRNLFDMFRLNVTERNLSRQRIQIYSAATLNRQIQRVQASVSSAEATLFSLRGQSYEFTVFFLISVVCGILLFRR